jgi:hypothetical protein
MRPTRRLYGSIPDAYEKKAVHHFFCPYLNYQSAGTIYSPAMVFFAPIHENASFGEVK